MRLPHEENIMSIKSAATILGLVTLAIGPVPSALLPMAGLDVAYAESGKSNGNGNGNGKSDSKGSESRGNSANASQGNSGGNAGKTATGGSSHGDLASELKGLNAVKANPNALEHAAPDSQVGRIAAYKDAAELTISAASALADAEAALAELDVPARGTDEIDAVIAALDPAAEGYEAELAALTAERAAAEIYEDALVAVTVAAEQVDKAEKAERAALLTASDGRQLSDEAIAYIREVLDL
jgi:hypothetical protein